MQVLDCDYVMFKNKPLVRLFGKTKEGEAVCAFTSGMLPYFYLDVKGDMEQARSAIEKELNVQAEVVERIIPLGFQKPKKILKIIGRDPSAVPEMKKTTMKFGTPYEADILFKYRYLVDHDLKGMCWVRVQGRPAHTSTVKCKAVEAEKIETIEKAVNAPLRYISLDIESVTDSDDRFLEAEKDAIVIISLCFFPDYKNKRTLVLSAKPIKTGSDVIVCSDEREILTKFIDIVNNYDPDVVIGYNINNFDLPFIVKRLEILQLPRDFGRTEKPVFCRKLQNSYHCSISGRAVVDPYEIIKKDPWVKFKRYDLGTIAREMLGEGKIEINGIRGMREFWSGGHEEVKKVIDYSRKDAELAMRLVIEKGLLDKFFELAKISGLLLQDTFGGQSQRHECKLLHEFRKRNMIIPCKPESQAMEKFMEEREDRGLKGAIVLDPETGLHKDSLTIVLDFTSLYPSIIRTYNICPTTLLLNSEDIVHFTTPQGVRFVKPDVREGVLPAVLRELMEARAEAKKQMKIASPEQKRLLDAKQLALKDMANSVHPETDIVVKDNFGKIKVIEIGNLFGELEKSHEIKKVNENIEVIELSGWQTLSVEGDKSCFKPLYAISRHRNKEKLIRIRTKMGEVKTTPDHSIIEMKGKNMREVRGSKVDKNTIIAHVKFDINDNLDKIDHGDLFGQPPIEIEEAEPSDYVYDLSVRDTEKFVTAQGLVLHNSMYGYTGYMRARLYVMDVANSVTAYGRENIIKTKKLIEDNYHKMVVYGDSITANRFVTIMNNGRIEIKNIEELFLENAQKTETARDKEFINLEGYKALTLNPNTKKAEWMPIKQIIRHKTNKKIFRMNQKFGESVVTEDHSIITERKGKLEKTKPQDMAGKEMKRVKDIPKPNQIKFIDLHEILSKYEAKTIYKKREKISSIKEEGSWLVFGWTNRKNPVKIKRIIKTDSEEFESLCRLVGAHIAEGSSSTAETTKSRFGASIASSDLKWLEQLKEDYLRLFKNAKTSIVKSTKKKRTLQMMNRLAAVFFKMLCRQKSYGKKIPEFVYHVPEKYQKIVLENMIKGDGSHLFMNMRLNYSEQYKKKNFRYETRSLQLMGGLSFLLSLLGQNYTIRYRSSKKTYILTTTTNNNSNTPTKIWEESYNGYVYDLSVEGSHMFVDSCGQILLHNTDSIFVKTDTTDLEKAEREGMEISEFVTENLPGALDLKFEKIYKTFLILTKKRYAGWKFEREGDVWKDKIEMKGIETVRRDWCSLTSETMLDMLRIILKEGDIQKAAKFVRTVIEDLSMGKIPLEKLTIVKGVTKSLVSYKGVQPHVELAKKIEKRDPTKSIIVGERLGFVIVKGNQLISKRAEDPEYVKEKGLDIDSQYYIENQLLPPIERIFEVCGIRKSELIEGSRQKKLFELFSAKSADIKPPELTTLKGFDSVVCKKCDWSFRRVPLAGKCPKCGCQLFFQKDGSIGLTVEMEN